MDKKSAKMAFLATLVPKNLFFFEEQVALCCGCSISKPTILFSLKKGAVNQVTCTV